jgi:uncharacterized protein YjdB
MTDSNVSASGFDNSTIGKNTITLNYNKLTTTFDVNIIEKPIQDILVDGIELDNNYLELKVGDETYLVATITPDDATNKNIIWNSSDDTIVSVNSEGKISALKEGEAIITVTSEDGGKTISAKVVVSSIDINDSQNENKDIQNENKDIQNENKDVQNETEDSTESSVVNNENSKEYDVVTENVQTGTYNILIAILLSIVSIFAVIVYYRKFGQSYKS